MLNCHAKKTKSKDKAILEMFYVKESSSLVNTENVGTKIQKPDF